MKYIIIFITAALLMGCASEPNYSGSYILTVGGGSVRFELKPDGSFIGSPEGEDKDAVGTWKVEGDLLVCEGTIAKSSDQLTIKFNKTTFELISLAENGKEVPLDRMIPDGAVGIYLKKVGLKSSSAETESAEPDYLGNYSLTLPKERITLNLASDGSFILAGLGGSNVVGTWKEKGNFLVCEGTPKKDSARITVKFNKATLKLISLAKNGREAPLKEWTQRTGEIYLRRNTGSPEANRALLGAAREGDIEAVKQYLDAGADINVQNVRRSQSWTPLFNAVAWGKKEVAELLIAKGADVNRKCEDFMTPLHMAVSSPFVSPSDRKEIAKLLISNGADVNARDMLGGTPLDGADDKETADLLRKHGGKYSTIYHAAEGRDIEAVKEFLANGADVNARDRMGRTPLDSAKGETAELLRKHGGKTRKELKAEVK